ncbi:MAG: SseB family protein [Frankia sp.]|nr:SseB family protein [Frankia sp.]
MGVDLLTPPGQGDSGEADPRLRAALEAGDVAAVRAALAGARVFVGVESRLLERAASGGDKKSEIVLATLRLPSGASALPVFTSVAALSSWRRSARPVPVPALDACAEAARLGHESVVIDVAGPVPATLAVSLVDPAEAGEPRADRSARRRWPWRRR